MSINVVEKIDDLVKVRHVLASVSDKGGLETFIPALLRINPKVKIFSTGGTFGRIKEILGQTGGNLSDTGFGLHRPARNPGRPCKNARF